METEYRVGDVLRLYLQRKVPGAVKPAPVPELIVAATVLGVKDSGRSYAVRQNNREGLLADGILVFDCVPAEQWYVLGMSKV